MRIAYIARGCRPGAGIERYTYELALRMSRRHDVDVITDPRNFSECGARLVPISVLRKPLWLSILQFSRRAGETARRGGYDLVHTQGSDGTWGDVVTAHACHWAGMRASLKINPQAGNFLKKMLNPAHRVILSLESQVFASARCLIAVSRRVSRQLRAAYVIPPHLRQQVIYPGVDLESHDPAVISAQRPIVREQLGVKSDQVVFLLAANSLGLKGAYRLVRALALCPETRSVLLFASAGGCEISLARLADRLHVGARVMFLAAGRDIRRALAAADVYAALPEYESFGLTVLEAMAAGLPLLLSRNAGVTELLRPGREGIFLAALASEREIARAISRLAMQPELRKRLGRTARQRARIFSWDRMADELEGVYAVVAGDPPAGAKKN